jgi:hypothetical protein
MSQVDERVRIWHDVRRDLRRAMESIDTGLALQQRSQYGCKNSALGKRYHSVEWPVALEDFGKHVKTLEKPMWRVLNISELKPCSQLRSFMWLSFVVRRLVAGNIARMYLKRTFGPHELCVGKGLIQSLR